MNEENILEGFELVVVSDQVENANNILDGFELVEEPEVVSLSEQPKHVSIDKIQGKFEEDDVLKNLNDFYAEDIKKGLISFETSGGMRDEQFKLLSDLIMEKNVIIKGEHSPTSQNYINKTVFPYRQYLAAKIIKQQWRMCRWNPIYTMCKTIQYKNYTNIINSVS